MKRRDSDNDPYVGHACQVCGKRVLVSNEGPTSGYWRTDPETREVTAWHLSCLLGKTDTGEAA